MATLKVKALEESCFDHIIKTIEEYPADTLALLPAKIRFGILVNLPVVDVCRLEETLFVSGLDMAAAWEQLYKEYAGNITFYTKMERGAKDSLLSLICRTVLADERPYGYFQDKTWFGFKITENRPAHELPVDIINHLVTTKKADLPVVKGSGSMSIYYPAMTRHKVIKHMGIVPPGSLYQQACESRQVMLQRYAHLFSPGSLFLCDSVAIGLLTKECNYRPKKVYVSCPKFFTFLLNAKHESTNLSFLGDLLKEVESLVIDGEKDDEDNLFESVSSEALEFVLSGCVPKLSTLHIYIHHCKDEILRSVAPILTSRFGNLTELIVDATMAAPVALNLNILIRIVEHQSQLQTIKIALNEPLAFLTPQKKSKKQVGGYSITSYLHSKLLSLAEICFKKASLRVVTLWLDPVPEEFLQKLVSIFLTIPCSSIQTLKLKLSISDKMPFTRLQSSPLPVDDTLTLRYKAIEITCSHRLDPFFVAGMFRQVKLKELVLGNWDDCDSAILSQLARQEGFGVETVRIQPMLCRLQEYESVVQMPLMKSLHFVNCHKLCLSALASGLSKQPVNRSLIDFGLSFTDGDKNKEFTYKDNDALSKFFCSLFSLPQLPQFSLSLHVAFAPEQVEMLHTCWENQGGVTMRTLSVRIPKGVEGSTVQSKLEKMAAEVHFETF